LAVGWALIVLAIVFAASPLWSGYFDFKVWGPLALAGMVLLVIVARAGAPALTRYATVAGAALAGLVALTAASMLWAQSKDSAWTSLNRLALYAVIFAIGLIAARERRVARAALLILGCSALLTALWLSVSLVLGANQTAFVERRLDAPIGYINGTAGLLVMGLWPWIALAETARRRLVRAAALAGATVIAATCVLTQSRAVVPALLLSALAALACAGNRSRRALNMLIVAAAVAASLPWTLAVYSRGGAAARLLLPGHGLLRAAAISILLAGLGAGLVRLLAGTASEQLGERRQGPVLRVLGWAIAALAALALIGGGVAGSSWLSREYRAFTSLKVNQDASVRFVDASGFRYDLWRVALHEFADHPLGGVGAGNYDAFYYRLRNNPDYVLQPHSLELQMAAELGLGGIALLIAFCGAILAGGFARSGTLASRERFVRLAALGIFTAWLADTSVDWIYDIPGLTAMALLAGGILVAPAAAARSGRHGGAWARGRLIGAVAGLAALALLAASVGRQYAASRYQASGASKAESSPRAAIGTLRTAARLDPYSVDTLYSLAAAYARLDDYQRAREAVLLAAAREPFNYVPPALLGDLAMRRGDFGVAAREYRRALTLNPRDVQLTQDEQLARERAAARSAG
jgi:hypothetical protein